MLLILTQHDKQLVKTVEKQLKCYLAHQNQRISLQHFLQGTFHKMCELLTQHQRTSVQAIKLQGIRKTETKDTKATAVCILNVIDYLSKKTICRAHVSQFFLLGWSFCCCGCYIVSLITQIFELLNFHILS